MKVPQEDVLCLRSGSQAEVTHHPKLPLLYDVENPIYGSFVGSQSACWIAGRESLLVWRTV